MLFSIVRQQSTVTIYININLYIIYYVIISIFHVSNNTFNNYFIEKIKARKKNTINCNFLNNSEFSYKEISALYSQWYVKPFLLTEQRFEHTTQPYFI